MTDATMNVQLAVTIDEHERAAFEEWGDLLGVFTSMDPVSKAPDLAMLEASDLHARAGGLCAMLRRGKALLAAQAEQEQRDLEMVKAFHARRRAPAERLIGQAELELEAVARALKPHFGKKQSWPTPWGTLQFRKQGGGPKVEDREAFDTFVKARYPELTTEEVVVKVPLKTALPVVVEREAGELPPGVVWVDAYESFSYKLEAGEVISG